MNRLEFRHKEDLARFMSKVKIVESGCWEWTAARFSKGYGQFTMGPYNHRAHRVSNFNFNGPFKETLEVMHKCDNPWCVCPEHLMTGTNQQNRTDSVIKGRHNIGSKNGNSSLTEEKVSMIKTLLQTDISQASIAISMGVSPMTISRIARKETWNHV